MKHLKIKIMLIALLAAAAPSMVQSLGKVNWLNESQQREIKEGKALVMDVPVKTDFWWISRYGLMVDGGSLYYATYDGEFEVKVKIIGNYVTTFNQMGLMLRIDHENWIKVGVEYVDGGQNVSTVVTRRTSDWNVVQLPDAPYSLQTRAIHRLDAAEVSFSRDGKEYTMICTCWLQDNYPVMVGLIGACPDGKGFIAALKEFKVTPLAGQRRLGWAKKQVNK